MKYDLSIALDRKRAHTRFLNLMDQEKRIDLTEYKPPRTLQQNKYLHVCIGLIAQETGYTLEECKVVLKEKHGLTYDKGGHTFTRSTRDLDSAQMTAFIDWMRHLASEELGIYIPTAEEYAIDPYMVDKELQNA